MEEYSLPSTKISLDIGKIVKILLYICFFLLIVWFVTKPWRDKNNVKIEFRQIFLRLFQVLPRFISPYIIFRLIMKLLRRLL